MSDTSKLPHPLQQHPGSTQKERLLPALDPTKVKIEGRNMTEVLDFILKFSRQVIYYDNRLNTSDWASFFYHSLPFTIAAISQTDVQTIETNYSVISSELEKNPAGFNLKLVSDYIYREGFAPWAQWHNTFENRQLALGRTLEKIIANDARLALLRYIGITNAANERYGVVKPDFQPFLAHPIWGIDITNLYATDNRIPEIPGDDANGILDLRNRLDGIFGALIQALQSLVSEANDIKVLEDSLFPSDPSLAQQHAPHLGLMFAFLKLFDEVKGNLNKLSTRHLDFFYQQVLQIKAAQAVPDAAHIVFETQKQIPQYRLKKDTKLKDGKDVGGKEILFGLDDEIVVDKAQVAEIKTLYLNPVAYTTDTDTLKEAIEGLYIAPQANTADGQGAAFRETDSPDWYTLGNKKSKLIPEDKETPLAHPHARLGFVLASPVLLLNEGDRKVTITLTLTYDDIPCVEKPVLDITKRRLIQETLGKSYYLIDLDSLEKARARKLSDNAYNFLLASITQAGESVVLEDALSPAAFSMLDKALAPEVFEVIRPFTLYFSGAEAWIKVLDATINLTGNGPYELKLMAALANEIPAVTFFNADALMEKLDTTLPVVKIALDDRIKVRCDGEDYSPECCLEKDRTIGNFDVSLYHFFRHFHVDDVNIEVEVCGMRNLVVQNDENVQDVNNLIYPFGVRPVVDDAPCNINEPNPDLKGSSFFIGSKEVFCKNWNKVWVNLNWKDKPNNFETYYNGYQEPSKGIDTIVEDDFRYLVSVLDSTDWQIEKTADGINDNSYLPGAERYRKLFASYGSPLCPSPKNPYDQRIEVDSSFFDIQHTYKLISEPLNRLDVDTANGFLRLTLKCRDFQHKRYPFILARQMMAFGRYPTLIDGAVYIESGVPHVFDISVFFGNIGPQILEVATELVNSALNGILDDLIDVINAGIDSGVNLSLLDGLIALCKQLMDDIRNLAGLTLVNFFGAPFNTGTLSSANQDAVNDLVKQFVQDLFDLLNTELTELEENLKQKIQDKFDAILDAIDTTGFFLNIFGEKEVVIPNEPYTPVLKVVTLDYTAAASIEDIDLTHLHPFENTYEAVAIEDEPSLLPVFVDEGTLYLGFTGVTPGNHLNLLFQLAEATANSESDKAAVKWHYLLNNRWIRLRENFDIINDATKGLTRSGIIKIATPENISDKNNTILSEGFYWLKASASKRSTSVAHTMGIHTQAVKAVALVEEGSNTARLSIPLEAGSLAKLLEADTNIKQVVQPYVSFGGRDKEASNTLYRRLSEHLRHKGRAISPFDYERMVLQQFPELLSAKCINHTLGLPAHQYLYDYHHAPGFVLLAVIPDITTLQSGDQTQPRLPVSLLDEIKEYLKKKNCPFARLRVMNPRYEGIDIQIKVKFYQGKGGAFYKEQLRADLRRQLAPWVSGALDQLRFGRQVSKSEVIRFVEALDYIDYICSITLGHECDPAQNGADTIVPLTARSILTAGRIEVDELERPCDRFDDQARPCVLPEPCIILDDYE